MKLNTLVKFGHFSLKYCNNSYCDKGGDKKSDDNGGDWLKARFPQDAV